jgi:capsular exopolysaccharide synthesis family protein
MENSSTPLQTNSLRKFVVYLKRLWWIPTLTLLVGLGGGALYTRWIPPVFVSSATMWQTEKLHLSEGALFTDDSQNYIGTQIELMKSGHTQQAAIERLRASSSNAVPTGPDGFPLPVTLGFRQAPKSSLFIIDASSANATYSQNFLNALMNEYLEYKKSIRKSVSGETAASISAQVESSERELKDAQDALNVFQHTNNLAILQEEGTISGGRLAKLQADFADLKLQLQILNATAGEQNSTNQGPAPDIANAGDYLHSLGGSSVSGAGSSQLSAFQELTLLKQEKEKWSQIRKPKHPAMVKLDAQIARAETLIEMSRAQTREQIAATQQSVKMKMESILASIKEWEPKATDANARIAEAEHLKLNVAREQSLYDRLNGLLQSVDISRNTDLETLAILDPASSPRRSYAKEVGAVQMAGFGGLALGLGLIFLLAFRDDRFNSPADVNEKFGDVIVGQVPETPLIPGQTHTPLLAIEDERDMYAESYRNLRSAIFFMPAMGERPKILVVTSAQPNEGKSTVAANLARTVALSGARVLLVDADLRRGYLHELLGMRCEPGFTDLLENPAALDAIIQHDTIPNFSFIARGKGVSNPGDIFLSNKLDSVFARLREKFDYVMIDTSPIFATNDAPTLAPKADGTLFVVRNGFSSAAAVKEALEVLAQRRVKVLGLVFNRADSSAHTYYYYKHSEYYRPKKTA